MRKLNEYSGGFVALTAVLVVSFLVLAVATSISLLGVGEAKSSHDYRLGQEAQKIAEACVGESLLRLRNDSNYLGTASALALGSGTCTIIVTGTGNDRTVNIESEINYLRVYRKRLEITAKVAGKSVGIVSWREVN